MPPLLALLALLLALGPARARAAEPVRVDFYSEALCPFCANFTLSQLAPLWANKLIKHVELDLIPFGNARLDPAIGQMQCQHGPLECELNRLLNCAVAQNPLADDWFPFLECVERAAMDGPVQARALAHACAVHAGIVAAKLMACYNGELGKSLQRLAAQRTAGLRPPHQFVPWVVVNGVPLLEDTDNLQRYICVAYTGKDRPKACLELPAPEPEGEAAGQEQQQAAAELPTPQAAATQARPRHCRRDDAAGGRSKLQQEQQL